MDNLLINGNWFKEHPEKILGEPKEVMGMRGMVTIYTGDENVLERIEVDAPVVNNPTVSTKTQIDRNDPVSKKNIKDALDRSAKDVAEKQKAVVKKKKAPEM